MELDTTRNQLSELQLDVDELQTLIGQTIRPQVKALLQNEQAKKQNQIRKLESQASSAASAKSQAPTVKIMNYAWDQSDNFVKLFVTLNRVQDLPADSIKTVFDSKSMELLVMGLEGKNHCLKMTSLHSVIDPAKSYHKVKQDMVVVFMKKTSSKSWASVSALDQKTNDLASSSKFDDKADPSQSIMNLMKKMYDDGDDEMKRTITKAWCEAREKQKEEPFM